MANSKKKGSRFERSVAKFFTKWTGFEFGRTPGSGSFHNNRDLGSDLICNDDRHKNRCLLSIECKSYKDIRFEHVLLGNKRCKIFSFWEQALRDALRTKKFPILCMRYNSMHRDEFFFVVNAYIAKELINTKTCKRMMTINAPEIDGNTLYVFMSPDIINNTSYRKLHKALRKEAKNLYK